MSPQLAHYWRNQERILAQKKLSYDPKRARAYKVKNRTKIRKSYRKYWAAYYPKNKAKLNKRSADWQKANPDYRKHHHLRYLYGIEPEQFEALKARQNGACAVCKRVAKLCVDHDHSTGQIRGLLCSACNRGLGCFADSTVRIESALVYLKYHQ